MKLLTSLALLVILTGCASTQTARVSTPSETNTAAARDAAINARAAEYMRSGASQREAYAKAESDIDGTLTPLRKVEPTRRGMTSAAP